MSYDYPLQRTENDVGYKHTKHGYWYTISKGAKTMKARITFHHAFIKQEVLNQAMELYRLGMEVESERQLLMDIADEHGLSASITLEQSMKVSAVCRTWKEAHTAHEQMAKINGLFQDDNVVKQPPVRRLSIQKQLEDARQEIKNSSKQPAAQVKNKDSIVERILIFCYLTH